MRSADPRRVAIALTPLALVAFASNSILCRLALGSGRIDAGMFTGVRLLSGAVALLGLLAVTRRRAFRMDGSWAGAAALFAYAALFSIAYLRLAAGVGALILFGAVQTTMIGWGLFRGERPSAAEVAGFVLAIAGLAGLGLPGAGAPDPAGAVLMACAGVAWGIYSLRGRGSADPLATTSGNFLRSVILCAPLVLWRAGPVQTTAYGLVLAVASGAIASGLGYAIWYAALRGLTALRAAILQLTVPVLTAAGGVALLGESISLRLVAAGAVILGGLALAILGPRR